MISNDLTELDKSNLESSKTGSYNKQDDNTTEQRQAKSFSRRAFVPLVIGVSILFTVVYSYLTVEYENFRLVFFSTFLPRIILGVILVAVGIRRLGKINQ